MFGLIAISLGCCFGVFSSVVMGGSLCMGALIFRACQFGSS